MKGEVLDGGADGQIVRKGGVAKLGTHYQIKTDDGLIMYIKNVGLRVATLEIAVRTARREKCVIMNFISEPFSSSIRS